MTKLFFALVIMIQLLLIVPLAQADTVDSQITDAVT